jgi:Plasma-membrane choline transporter
MSNRIPSRSPWRGKYTRLIFIAMKCYANVYLNRFFFFTLRVMATWCFVSEEADHCCSPAVSGSLVRSLTYSFGSICLGSLLQAIVSVLRYIVETARNRRDTADQQDACGNLCFCILDCLARWLEDLVEYFNQWAYCFVGIYGLSYVESGKKVMELFRARGWTSIVTDNLVGYTMAYAAFAVGIGTGFVGLIVERAVSSRYHGTDPDYKSYIFGPIPGAKWWAFG